MKYVLGFFGVVVVVGLFLGLWVMGTYNSLVKQNEAVTAQWAQVQTQYQRRFDLVPNLANAVKGILKQEQAVFGEIAQARSHYVGAANGSNAQVQALNEYNTALSHLTYVVEAYPVLKSNEQVQSLMDELAGTENRIAVVRDRYNGIVLSYNQSLLTFPRNVLASSFGFEKREFFEATSSAQEAPTVNLDVTK